MRHFLLSLFLLNILLNTSLILFAKDSDATRTVEDAYKEMNASSKKLIEDTKKELSVEQLDTIGEDFAKILESKTHFFRLSQGAEGKVEQFKNSDSSAQSSFINAWGTAANAIRQASYKQSSFVYSTVILEAPNVIGVFYDIATYLNPQVKQILQRYLNLKPEEDPTVIFKTIYYTLLYQWLTYRLLIYTQIFSSLQTLESIIDLYKQDLHIDTNDSKLMNELKREYQILSELLESRTLPKSLDKYEAYLALVRDYTLDVVIPPIQLEPPIRLIPEDEAHQIKRENLEELSKRPEFKELKERNLNNPLVVKVEQELGQLQPEPAIPQALFGNLTNLSTQLIQLRTSITR